MRLATESRPVIVTGGAGFVGSHLCDRLLQDGETVLCIDSMLTGRIENLSTALKSGRLALVRSDVASVAWKGLPPAKAIYHLACPASPPHYQADPIHTMMTCVAGTCAMLEYAVASRAPLLFASTSEVYGDPEMHPQTESYRGSVSTTGPRACYDEGKRAAEALCYDFARTAGASIRVARIFNTYGPRMRSDDGRVVSNFIVQALGREPLTVYGDGRQTRSFCYVADLVEGLVRLMNHEDRALSPVNLGNPQECTVRKLAKKICKLTGADLQLENSDLPEDDPQRRKPDISCAIRLLGWRPETDLEAGLAQTIAAFREEARAGEGARQPAQAVAAE